MISKSVSNRNNAGLFLWGLALFVFVPSLVLAQTLVKTKAENKGWVELPASKRVNQVGAPQKPVAVAPNNSGQVTPSGYSRNANTDNTQSQTPAAQGVQNTKSPQAALQAGNPQNVQVKPVTPASSQYTSSNPQNKQKEEIKLYMTNFKISKTLSGSVTCSMRFYLKSTLKNRISNLSYRLKWAKMETPLSFDDVEPSSTVYQEYALLGNGCYTMDTPPNVIVNRCRVKDMTQEACASKIEWIQ